jgi:hypothetical protein
MNTITIQYPGYTIEIADHLTRQFRVLSTILKGVEFEHPAELLSNSVTSKLITKCNECINASIGKEFAHQDAIRDALANWSNLTQFEKLTTIIEAAAKTEPLDISSVLVTSPDNEID